MNRFKNMSDTEILGWLQQYGDRNSGFYPGASGQRRKAYAEARNRGLNVKEGSSSARPKGYGPGGNEYLKFWGIKGQL